MSRNESEQGEIKLPPAGFKLVHTAVIDAEDHYRDRMFRLAEQTRTKLLEMGKGKRGFDYYQTFDHNPAFDYARGQDVGGSIHFALFPRGEDGRPAKKPHVPKKKAFAPPNSRTLEFNHGDFGIAFDRKARTVSWSVHENNHAVEHARRHPVAMALFNALDRVEWTRNTGGVLTGNDEYNRESKSEGGGGNYVTKRFGPLGKADDADFMVIRRR